MNKVEIHTRNGRVAHVIVDGVEVRCTRVAFESEVDQLPVVHISVPCWLELANDQDSNDEAAYRRG